MAWTKKQWRNTWIATLYLSPNIIGFLVFTLFPLIFSLIMAFTNWDLKQHNMFREKGVEFIGFENFTLLFTENNFADYLINTLIMMIGIPFGMAGSLVAALLLSAQLKGKNKGDAKSIFIASGIITACMLVSTCILMFAGMMQTAILMVIVGLLGMLYVAGAATGSTIYRTVFYLPSFTSGVAIFLLWKKIYNPKSGPLNNFLREPVDNFSGMINALPSGLVQCGMVIGYLIIAALHYVGFKFLRRSWNDGETGITGCVLGILFLMIAPLCAWSWIPTTDPHGHILVNDYSFYATFALLSLSGVMCYQLIRDMIKGRDFTCKSDYGLGTSLMVSVGIMTIQLSILGIGIWMYFLPDLASNGMEPPNWLTNYHWAKPSLILMGLWSSIGSNSMLLYLAGLSGIPQSLYEAADIDGAKGLKRFWHITWPQLAPVTFFIFVMAIIGGLQGGFEMAKTMTQGGPAGSTTTLAYYIYSEGFETGRLGFASAVAWAMFVLVFAITMFNWKFGSKYTND